MIGKSGKMNGDIMTHEQVTLITKEDLVIPVSQFVGTMPNIALLDKSKYGPAWWEK